MLYGVSILCRNLVNVLKDHRGTKTRGDICRMSLLSMPKWRMSKRKICSGSEGRAWIALLVIYEGFVATEWASAASRAYLGDPCVKKLRRGGLDRSCQPWSSGCKAHEWRDFGGEPPEAIA